MAVAALERFNAADRSYAMVAETGDFRVLAGSAGLRRFDSFAADVLYWESGSHSRAILRIYYVPLPPQKEPVMSHYRSLSDDFYLNMNLNTEMDLPQTRETVLHYFEQVQKKYPSMRNFYGRDRGEFVLEEDKDRGDYRWMSVEPRRICSGQVNPSTLAEALKQHEWALELAPYALSLSPLDCESLNVMFGFDFTYRGNHNELLIEALGVCPSLERMTEVPGATVLGSEPSLQLALDDDCRIQCRLSVETRTAAYHVRTGDYPEEQLSVYFTARRYGSLDAGETFVTAMRRLSELCVDLVDNYVVENILRPLQRTIAIK